MLRNKKQGKSLIRKKLVILALTLSSDVRTSEKWDVGMKILKNWLGNRNKLNGKGRIPGHVQRMELDRMGENF
jgi:hypothetical protein